MTQGEGINSTLGAQTNSTLGERIKTARKAMRLTQTTLARELGIAPQSVQQWEANQSEPRRKRMADLAAALNVSVAYLEHGSEVEVGPVETGISGIRTATSGPQEISGRMVAPPIDSSSPHANVELTAPNTQNGKVPLISWVQAGSWNEAIDYLQPGDADAWLPCPVRHGPRTYALRVKGDSMTAPHGKSYPEGSVIYVDPDQAGGVTTGDRVIAKLSGQDAVTFKCYVEDAGRRYLKPLNPAYPLIIDPFAILGKVILKMEFE